MSMLDKVNMNSAVQKKRGLWEKDYQSYMIECIYLYVEPNLFCVYASFAIVNNQDVVLYAKHLSGPAVT